MTPASIDRVCGHNLSPQGALVCKQHILILADLFNFTPLWRYLQALCVYLSVLLSKSTFPFLINLPLLKKKVRIICHTNAFFLALFKTHVVKTYHYYPFTFQIFSCHLYASVMLVGVQLLVRAQGELPVRFESGSGLDNIWKNSNRRQRHDQLSQRTRVN